MSDTQGSLNEEPVDLARMEQATRDSTMQDPLSGAEHTYENVDQTRGWTDGEEPYYAVPNPVHSVYSTLHDLQSASD